MNLVDTLPTPALYLTINDMHRPYGSATCSCGAQAPLWEQHIVDAHPERGHRVDLCSQYDDGCPYLLVNPDRTCYAGHPR